MRFCFFYGIMSNYCYLLIRGEFISAVKWAVYQESITKERNESEKFMQIRSGENLEISIYLDPFRVRYANMRYNIDCVNIPVRVPEDPIASPNLRRRIVKKYNNQNGNTGSCGSARDTATINLKLDCLGGPVFTRV